MTVLYKDKVKGYDVCVAKTDSGAFVGTADITYSSKIHCQIQLLPGLFGCPVPKTLEDAKEYLFTEIEKDIVFEEKYNKAVAAFEKEMRQ